MITDQPARHQTVPGTRRLADNFGLVGYQVVDPLEPTRPWWITSFYSPLTSRAVQGIRARLQDQYGFVTFCNQRDLETLLGIGEPATWCKWLGRNYQHRSSDNWAGLTCDYEDLRDDLYERELEWRHHYAQHGHNHLSGNPTIERRVHEDVNKDFEEYWVFIQDRKKDSGESPDLRFSSLLARWSRSHKNPLR